MQHADLWLDTPLGTMHLQASDAGLLQALFVDAVDSVGIPAAAARDRTPSTNVARPPHSSRPHSSAVVDANGQGLTAFFAAAAPRVKSPSHMPAQHQATTVLPATTSLAESNSHNPANQLATQIVQQAAQQISEYFAKQRYQFDVPLAPAGTAFQRQVWLALCQVGYGHHCSYAAIAQKISQPTAVRAVGAANGRNPIPIIIPCHRVVGASGHLTGYAGGLGRKQWLLAFEQDTLT
jgi:methylated-DNA-[protein]-cysteine S-methyltransferase